MSVKAAAAAGALAVALAGCGNDVTKPPDIFVPDPPEGERTVRLPQAGLRFTAPFNWADLEAQGLRVGGIRNKRATIAVWRYARSEPLPDSRRALEEVERLLVERVRRRDPTFELTDSSFPRRDGARSIELVGRQTIAGLKFQVRSAHIFAENAEIVVDAYVPPEHFARVDTTVVRPLLASLRISKPRT